MPRDLGGVRRGTSSLSHTLGILGQALDGGLSGGYYGADFKGFWGVTQG